MDAAVVAQPEQVGNRIVVDVCVLARHAAVDWRPGVRERDVIRSNERVALVADFGASAEIDSPGRERVGTVLGRTVNDGELETVRHGFRRPLRPGWTRRLDERDSELWMAPLFLRSGDVFDGDVEVVDHAAR